METTASSMALRAKLLLLLCCCGGGLGARILGIFPTPSISHQLPFQTIMKALAARGHHVTVISPDPLKSPVPNYTDIDVSESYKYWRTEMDFETMDQALTLTAMRMFTTVLTKINDIQLSSAQVQAMIKSQDTKFDLVIIEMLCYQSYYGLIHHVGSPPMVGVISLGGSDASFTALGNPNNPAYSPDLMTPYSDHMSFWERMQNTYVLMCLKYHWKVDVLPAQEALLRKHFGSSPPSVFESEYNASLLLLNNHWSLSYPRPLLPNVVELTGLHVQTTSKPLPKDIQSFLDGAKHGFIYFSLGSNVRSDKMPLEKRQQILEAFSELPQRVLWKWESDSLPGQPSNVMLGKWLPQQDILAHPNVRVFITQGGLQSFQEAAYHAVPLVGIPFMGDQGNNVGKFVAAGIGVKVDFKDLTKESILNALRKVLNDSSYRSNMQRFSAVFREHAGPSLERAIWWTEYVLRHNGAHHLRSAALDLAWYQYLLLDVVAVVALTLLLALAMSYVVLKKSCSFATQYFSASKLKTH